MTVSDKPFSRSEKLVLFGAITLLAPAAAISELDASGDVLAFFVYMLMSYVALTIVVKTVAERFE